jgi:GT2 family glycosyltransferase
MLGLTFARLAGFAATASSLVVLVDDDNVLAPDYLEQAIHFAETHPEAGVFGGKLLPCYAVPAPAWVEPFSHNLALRDFGDQELSSESYQAGEIYPYFAPLGAGMVLRREVITAYRDFITKRPDRLNSDRRGKNLLSGGDNDIVFCAWAAGWRLAYTPTLKLEHLIPANRLKFRYLCRLYQSINHGWVAALDVQGIRPWKPIPRWSLPLRKLLGFVRRRAWASRINYIFWRGDCGKFDGQADLSLRN